MVYKPKVKTEKKSGKMGLLLAAVAAIVLLAGGYMIFAGCCGGIPASAGKVANSALASASNGTAGAQDIYIRALANGQYDNMQVTVKKGTPVRLHFTADPSAGCGRYFKIYGLGVDARSNSGEEQVVEFTPTAEGTYDYSCGMRMWGPGKFTVTA
ncbi:Cupredoxin-like domain protein [Candidatus Gugararchaeum adminiculabundum]|nr:Cupredoxin-like domain protein [Candidatus Gugararchaeum adminiculabundum]